jgi:hypothetical protein
MKAVPEKPAAVQVALSTILPFVVVLCATQVTLFIGERYGTDTWPFVLVGWCAVLGVSATWLNRVVFRRTNTLLPFLAALVALLLVWLWQRQALTMLVPRSGLTYGYFLTPEGAKARFWALTCPFRVGLTGLSLCFVAAIVSASGWLPQFVSLHDSVVGHRVSNLLAAFDVLGCARKRLRVYLAQSKPPSRITGNQPAAAKM